MTIGTLLMTGATNSSGWTGLPGGYRYSGGFYSYGYAATGGLLQSPVPTHGTLTVHYTTMSPIQAFNTTAFLLVASGIKN